MSTLPSDATAIAPRVIHSAKYEVSEEDFENKSLPVELSYLRVLSSMPAFLLHDTAAISEDDTQTLEPDHGLGGFREGSAERRTRHHWIQLQHPELLFTAFYLHPERDVLWVSHETEDEALEELSKYYGPQLNAIQNVMFEQSEWDDLDDSLN